MAGIDHLKEKILPILRRYGVTRAGLFGSQARGDVSAGSDVDILVQLTDDVSLLDFIGLKQDLEEALRGKVDVVEYDTIKPVLKDRILREQIAIL